MRPCGLLTAIITRGPCNDRAGRPVDPAGVFGGQGLLALSSQCGDSRAAGQVRRSRTERL